MKTNPARSKKRIPGLTLLFIGRVRSKNNVLKDSGFRPGSQSGAALLFFISILLAVSVLAGFLVDLMTTSTLGTASVNLLDRAYFMAEAGGHYANPLIKQDIEADAFYDDTHLLHNQTFTLDDGTTQEGQFRILVDDTDPTFTRIDSIGTINTGISSNTEVQLTYTMAKTVAGGSIFETTLFAGDEITIEDRVTVDGDIGTNDSSISKGSNVTITGTEETNAGKTLDPITFSCGSCGSDKEVSGSETWSSGTYEYKKLLIKERENLTINGDVILYIKEDFILEERAEITLLANSSLTVYVDKKIEFKERASIVFNPLPDRAEDLVIYGTSNADSVTIEGRATFIGAIYAPNADILIKERANITGGIIGETLKIEQRATLTYDPDIMNISTPVGGGGGGVTFGPVVQYFSQ